MQIYDVHPKTPHKRHITYALDALLAGELVIFPTDTTYALVCHPLKKKAVEALYRIKGLSAGHPLSFLCRDLTQVAQYAVIENAHYRVLRHKLPGPFTFILPATREVPKGLLPKRKTVGIRIPDDVVSEALLAASDMPLLSTTVTRTSDDPQMPLESPEEMASAMQHHVTVMLARGRLSNVPSSVIDLTASPPTLLRQGAGETDWLFR